MLSRRTKSHKDAILVAFGFARLDYGFQEIWRDAKRESINITSAWFAVVINYWRRPIIVARVAYSHNSTHQAIERGLVLVEENYREASQFVGVNPLRTVDVMAREDKVHKALQAINIFEEEPIPRLESQKVPIVVEVSHFNGYRHLVSEGLFESTDPTWRQLKHALVETIEDFTPLYQDKELSEFVKTQVEFRA